MNQDLKELKKLLDRFKNAVDGLKPSENLVQSEDEITKIEQSLNDLDEKIADIESQTEDEEYSSQRPLMDKFSELKNDFEICKKNFYKKKDEVMTAHNQERLMRGELHGVEKKKAERDMALDQVKQVDEQGLIVNSIGENLKGAGANLTNINSGLKEQREQIERVGEKVVNMDTNIKKTGQLMGGIERRVFCRKFIVWLGIIVLTLANIIMIFLILAKGFGWAPFNDPTPTPPISYNGIDIQQGDINFADVKSNNYSFVMIKAGENTESFAKLSDFLEAAKNNDISAGIYWLIKNTEKELAKEEVSKAKEIATGVKDKKLKFSFYFTFEPTNVLISKNETISEFCKEIPIDCGLSLSYDNYTDYYKNYNGELQNIKNYWINTNNENDVKNDKKVKIWNVEGQYNNKYNKLKYK